MPLKHLLSMNDRAIRKLARFQPSSTMQIVVHPSWYHHFEKSFSDLTGDETLQEIANAEQFDKIQKHAETLDRLGYRDFFFFGEHLDHIEGDSYPRYEKTLEYMRGLVSFFEIYENLALTSHLARLRDTEQLAVLVLPQGAPNSSNYPGHFKRFLKDMTGNQPNFVYIYSQQYNNGELQRPYSDTARENGIPRSQFKDDRNLVKLEKIYEFLGLDEVEVSGGNIHQCILTAEQSLAFANVDNVRIAVDVSDSTTFSKLNALTKPNSSTFKEDLYYSDAERLLYLVNDLLRHPINLSELKMIGRLSPEEQFATMGRFYHRTIGTFNQIKQITSYKHESPILGLY